MAFFQAQDWHDGENKIHKLTGVPHNDNPSTPFLPPRYAQLVSRYSLLALGTLDAEDNIWCTVWGGTPPFAQQIAQSVLGVRTTVDASYDPVVQALYKGRDDGEVVRAEPPGPMISGLSIHLEERGRVKLYGRMIAGALSAKDEELSEGKGKSAEAQLVFKIEQSLGNCPKYLNEKKITSHTPSPQLSSQSTHLSQEAIDVVRQADLFFVASAHEHEDMDCNHRGGPPGFVRVYQPDDPSQPSEIVWPEYSGNNLYQTLGNLVTTPRAGICIPNFANGDALYLTGTTEVLVGKDAAHLIAKSKLAVRFRISGTRLVQDGLPFRGKLIDDDTKGRSPYNPRIRYLTTEKAEEFGGEPGADVPVKAKLVKKEKLTPTINRYRFALEDPKVLGPQKAGQYVALDFTDELDMGYSHMRDDDPTSLNDDYMRTFTVSSAPGSLGIHGEEFEITIRKVGAVTKWLDWQREGMLEVGVKGFGGEFTFDQSDGKRVGYVAAGIGITPLLGLVDGVDVERLKVFWTVGIRDSGLLLDIIKRYPQLKGSTRIFLTGNEDALQSDREKKQLKEVETSGWHVERRRVSKDDLTVADGDIDQWYTCTAPTMRKEIQSWLPGKSFIYENFDY